MIQGIYLKKDVNDKSVFLVTLRQAREDQTKNGFCGELLCQNTCMMAVRRPCSRLFLAVVVTSAFWFFIVLLVFAAPFSRKDEPDPGTLFVGPKDGEIVGVPHNEGADAVKQPVEADGARGGVLETTQTKILSKEEEDKLIKQGYKDYGFNKVVSDKIALDRGVPDTRHPKCRTRIYPSDLPKCSVVIIFHNEAWSALLRSVHSLLKRTPAHLLHEILLVDDFSDKPHLKEPLDRYVATLPKVKVVRQEKRVGLTRSRMAGAFAATGDVLVFLDCHIEANEGWYEPLAARIGAKSSTVVCPVIDVINQDNFDYTGVGDAFVMGSFNWNLIFKWQSIPQRIRQLDVKDETSEFRTPTMAGGLFAMSRQYFNDLGKYDHEMDIWGSENLELSFRIWQCGGRLEIVPCSRVGHVYRRQSPISFPKGVDQTTTRNALRLAEVWLDEYKEIFYKLRPDARQREYGDISERLALRKRLGCKSFKWYLEQVYPEQYVPDEKHMRAWGEIRNPTSALCVDTLGKNDGGSPIGVYQCHGMGSNQAFWYTKERTLRREDVCAEPFGREVILSTCSGFDNQIWDHTAGILQSRSTKLCLDRSALNSGDKVKLAECNSSDSQKWKFSEYNPEESS